MVSTEISKFLHLKVFTKTWSRDSHGLFDYEATNSKTSLLLIDSPTKLIRKKNDVKQGEDNVDISLEERELAEIKIQDSKFYLSNPINFEMQANEQNINDLQNKIWYVIKQEDYNGGIISSATSNISNDAYEIKINDIIKLGRVKYAITEIKLNNDIQTIDQNVIKPVFNLISDYKSIDPNPEVLCKICLSDTEEESNPMVNLCKCTGSISCVHFQCLKRWMHTKLNIKENDKKTVTLYSMRSFNCEICKTPYPLRFKSEKTNFYNIIDYVRPVNKNYIILESLNQLKDNNNYKSIQVISLEENEKIMMGRGHETDVRINDISVSRTHAFITLINNKILIKDLKSKFGTLVLIQNDIELTEKNLCLQIGRTYGEFTVTSNKDCLNKKESIKIEDKAPLAFNKSKPLFQVEKPDKKEDVKIKPSQASLNGMDVDHIQQLQNSEVFNQNFFNNINAHINHFSFSLSINQMTNQTLNNRLNENNENKNK